MKVREIMPPPSKKAIVMALKQKAKKNNPGETETHGDWNNDMHNGSYDNFRMRR